MPSIVEHLSHQEMPHPLQQGIMVPARNFIRYGDQFHDVFGGLDSRRITRSEVFEAFTSSDELGCKTAIAWGFPRGGRPGGKSLQAALDAIPNFVDILRSIRQSGLTESAYDKINSTPQVKNGVTTKVLHFSGSRTPSGALALIYDSRVQDHLLVRDWDEYRPLTKTLRRYVLEPNAAQYSQFLEITRDVASTSGWDAAAIEMFMFGDAPNKKPPRHK